MFERKKLGLLQPNLQGKLSYQGGKIILESPTSRKRKNDENQTPAKSGPRKDGIYEDPATPLTKRAKHCPVSGVDAAVQTEQTLLTPSANCQAGAIYETSTVLASTSSNDSSGRLVMVSAPQIREPGVGAVTPSQNKKEVSISAELKMPNEERHPSTSTATEVELSATVEAPSVEEKEQTLTDDQAIIDMITTDVPGKRYWEMIAAERKAALTTTLSENRQLYQRNSELQDRVHHLEHENTLLNKRVKETERLVELVSSVTEDFEEPPVESAEEAFQSHSD